MPFATEEFFAVFATYNQALWPLQILAYLAFVIQALLLAVAPFAAQALRCEIQADALSVLGVTLNVYAMVVYQLFGWLAGYSWPAVPMFGVTPCPATIFTVETLLMVPWRVARRLLVIPLLWTVIGSSAAVLLSVPQDYGLVVAGLIVLGVGLGRVLHASYADYSEPV